MRDAERVLDTGGHDPAVLPSRQTIDEKDLLLRHRDGDPDAFAAFVDAYKAPVRAFVRRSGVPASDCEDVFQDVFIKIHQNVDRFEAERELHPWVFTIVVNTTRSYFRRAERRAISIELAPMAAMESHGPSAERTCVARQALHRLERDIRELPDRHREALLLAVFENMRMKDIASVLDVPVNTVKTWLRRARARLLALASEENA